MSLLSACCGHSDVSAVAREDSSFAESLLKILIPESDSEDIFMLDAPFSALQEEQYSYDSPPVKSPVTKRSRGLSSFTDDATTPVYLIESGRSRTASSLTQGSTSKSRRQLKLSFSRPLESQSLQQSQSNSSIITPNDLIQMDEQGIPWNRFSISRMEYRNRRMREYSNYNNVLWNSKLEHARRMAINSPNKIKKFYKFDVCHRNIQPSIDHFQLRQLLWSLNNTETYFVTNSSLYKHNRIKNESTLICSHTSNQMASCHVTDQFIATGAFDSEISCYSTQSQSRVGSGHSHSSPLLFRKKLSELENSITNHVYIDSWNQKILAANNDQILRDLDLNRNGEITQLVHLPWAVNNVTPGNKGNFIVGFISGYL
jgi:hypothetical protein